jgi:hypothetical protein
MSLSNEAAVGGSEPFVLVATQSGEPPRSIEPPPTWSEDKELFASLPRVLQQSLARGERLRAERLAELHRAAAAEALSLEVPREQYETALPQLLETLQQQHLSEFGDLKTPPDIGRMAREDAGRYVRWDLQQRRIAELTREVQSAQERQMAEKQRRFGEFARRQDDILKELTPEMADAAEVAKLQGSALALKDVGFGDDELAASWHGQKDIPLRDHRMLLIARDAALWRQAQAKAKAKAKAATAPPLPPVLRSGVAAGRAAAREELIGNLTQNLETSGSLRDAAALLKARRQGR